MLKPLLFSLMLLRENSRLCLISPHLKFLMEKYFELKLVAIFNLKQSLLQIFFYFFLEIENHQILFDLFADLGRTENIDGENKLEIVFCVAGCVAKNLRNTPRLLRLRCVNFKQSLYFFFSTRGLQEIFIKSSGD